MFSRCVPSATWQIYRTLRSVTGTWYFLVQWVVLARPVSMLRFSEVTEWKRYTFLLSSEQVSRPHFQHSRKFWSWRRSEHFYIPKLCSSLMCVIICPLKSTSDSTSLTIIFKRNSPHARVSSLTCCAWNILLSSRAALCIIYNKVFWQVSFWFLQSHVNFPGPKGTKKYLFFSSATQ